MKHLISIAVASVAAFSANAWSAVPDGTYDFTSAPGNSYLSNRPFTVSVNGSPSARGPRLAA